MNTVCNLGDEVLTLYLFYLTRQALVDTVCFSLVCRAGPYKTELYKMVSRADNFNETISGLQLSFEMSVSSSSCCLYLFTAAWKRMSG